MKLSNKVIATLMFSPALLSCSNREEPVQLPSLDGVGLSGLYVGQIGDRLYAAGGSNFPDKPLIEGGKKAFHDEIWALGANGWELAGKLPCPSAYGAYLAGDEGLLILGGACLDGSLDRVWLLSAGGVEELDPLPKPLEQAAWYADGGKIYLAGGLSNGEPSLEVFALDASGWNVAATLPRPMVQPIATKSGSKLIFWGGFDPLAKEAVTGGWVLDTLTGEWSFLETDITFVGSAPLGYYAVGGCNVDIFNYALKLSGDAVREYQSQPVEYFKFRGELREFDPQSLTWKKTLESSHLARAGAGLAVFNGNLVSVGGEIKAGVRTPEVWMIKMK